MTEKFNAKERKKAFDSIYKETILPFMAAEGFQQVTKTSKRVYKEFDKDLSVYIYFEFINFGSGFYRINIVYYDDELGKESDDGIYLAAAKIKKPEIRGKNSLELIQSSEEWMREMQSTVLPFIHQHSTHQAISHSSEFNYLGFAEEQVKALLAKKSAE